MSAVIKQAKQLYRKILWLETGFLAAIFLMVMIVWGKAHAFSLLLGGISALIPQAAFIYWVFFRTYSPNINKMSVFYRAEGLKWLLTIFLMVAVFKLVSIEMVAFFAGYFIMLLCNVLLPLLLRRK